MVRPVAANPGDGKCVVLASLWDLGDLVGYKESNANNAVQSIN